MQTMQARKQVLPIRFPLSSAHLVDGERHNTLQGLDPPSLGRVGQGSGMRTQTPISPGYGMGFEMEMDIMSSHFFPPFWKGPASSLVQPEDATESHPGGHTPYNTGSFPCSKVPPA